MFLPRLSQHLERQEGMLGSYMRRIIGQIVPPEKSTWPQRGWQLFVPLHAAGLDIIHEF